MERSDALSVKNFAKLSRTTPATLHYYDKIGLLSPISRGENNYRYYSRGQISSINFIRTLQEFGMSLDEIKALNEKRTPEQAIAVFERQLASIDRKIETLEGIKKLIQTTQKVIRSVQTVNEEELTIQFLPEAPIILGESNDYSGGRDDACVPLRFYETVRKKAPNMSLSYPVWARFSQQQVKQRAWSRPECYYIYTPEGQEKRPAGLHAIGYARGGRAQQLALYERLLEFIEQNRFEVCGDMYQECPLNELCIAEKSNYLTRVMIMVREAEKLQST